MKTYLKTIVMLSAMFSPLAANAVANIYATKGEYASISNITYDNCSSSSNFFTVSDNSSQSKSVKTGYSFVLLYSYSYNWCTGSTRYVSGYSDTTLINVKKQGKTLIASGSLPVQIYDDGASTSTSDVVNFNLKFTQLSDFVSSLFGTTHQEFPTYPVGSTIKINQHYDQTASPASFTGTISGNYVDTTSPNLSSYMGSSKSHQVSISK